MIMNRTRDFYQRVREDFDWEGYVDANFQVKRTSKAELRVCCPNCHETQFKCYVNIDKGMFHCFKCKFSSDRKTTLVDFISKTESISPGDAFLKLLNTYIPTTPEDDEYIERVARLTEDPLDDLAQIGRALETFEPLDHLPKEAYPLKERTPRSAAFWDYLIDRGFTPEDIVNTQSHYVPAQSVYIKNAAGKTVGNLGRRILWPIYGGNHELVSWLAREIGGNSPIKYLNAPDSGMSHTLWPYVPPYDDKHVVLVEGLIDALAARRVGAPYSAYATLGKSLSKRQLLLLQKWGVQELTFAWDKKDAIREIEKYAQLARMYVARVYVADTTSWPKDRDPGKCLKLPDGTDILREALHRRIDMDSLEYLPWKSAF